LNVWFHVANQGKQDGGVGVNEYEAGIAGGRVIDAEDLKPVSAIVGVPLQMQAVAVVVDADTRAAHDRHTLP
jgi:hypothetical protein